MKPLIARLQPILLAYILAGIVVATLDLLVRGPLFGALDGPLGELAGATLLAVVVSAVMGALFGATIGLLVAGLSLVLQRPVEEGAPLEELRALLIKIFGESVDSARALIPAVLVWVAIAWGLQLLTRSMGFNNIVLVVASAVAATVAALGTFVLLRLLSRRFAWLRMPLWGWPLLMTLAAVRVVDQFWEYAQPYFMWPALLIVLTLAAVTMLAWLAGRTPRARKIGTVVATVAVLAGLAVVGLRSERGVAEARWMKSGLFGSSVHEVVRGVSDLDGDGASHLWGGTDCAPYDPDLHRNALEMVGNGIDENCTGADLASYEPLGAGEGEPAWESEARPPVILITVDSLRADHVGTKYKGEPLTPTIDALAKGSLNFTRAYSASTHTDESVPAILTGMYPHDWQRFGVYFGVEPTIAEVLRASGYDTAGVLAFPWLKISLMHGLSYIDNALGEQVLVDENVVTGHLVSQAALSYLDNRDDKTKPIFLWVHYYDPHGPTVGHPRLQKTIPDDPYRQEVRHTDDSIGLLIQGLAERGLFDDAVILFASDHGEGMGEHGVETHTWDFYESVVRVPMFMRLPGVAPASIDTPVSTVDIFPTLVSHLGVTNTGTREGMNLLPLATDKGTPRAPLLIQAEESNKPLGAAIVDGPLKLIHNQRRNTWMLFDVVADPGETRNLLNEREDDYERLRALLLEHRDLGFNNVRLERKRDRWEQRTNYEPDTFIGSSTKSKDAELQ